MATLDESVKEVESACIISENIVTMNDDHQQQTDQPIEHREQQIIVKKEKGKSKRKNKRKIKKKNKNKSKAKKNEHGHYDMHMNEGKADPVIDDPVPGTSVLDEPPMLDELPGLDEPSVISIIDVKHNTNPASQQLTFQQLPDDPTYFSHEERYVELWNTNQSNKQDLYSLICEKNKNSPEFVFMDGPPFVSGKLHPGHFGVGAAKSTLFNYKSMKGFNCKYTIGYDCHGLPIENLVAKENGLDTTEQINELGLAGFNELCEKTIKKYSESWTPLFQRMGRLADFGDKYMTRDLPFMESCIWIFKQLWDRGLVYRGNKVMAYSYANQTPLSNFEASQNYIEKETKSIYVGFEAIHAHDSSKEYFVAWTTTPWTLCANLALCVNDNVDYVKIKLDGQDDTVYILGKKCIGNLFNKSQKFTILEELKGSDLVGTEYRPLFPYTQNIDRDMKITREYKIISDPYVSEGDTGTAIVHLAPAFGEDDFRVCAAHQLVDNVSVSCYCPIDDHGRYLDIITEYKHRLVFDCDSDIRARLKKTGNLFKTALYKHNYPYCWRSNTPLIYRTTESYYIKVTALKDRLVELNQTVSWHPDDIGRNRFHQWLSNVKDWAISRFRYYGTPLPIWVTECGDAICVGSIAELEALTGTIVTNLHPEYINKLVITKDGKIYRRVPDIFDCWFESGAVPMAQVHYPIDPKSWVLDSRDFLSDFICEGMDQTRGWFYTLLVLSTAIFDRAPYRHVMCTGMVLDKDGKKFSKKLGNFVDPVETIKEFGADITRAYFINSPIMQADCLKFDSNAINKLKRRLIPYINGVKFLIEHTLNYKKTLNISDLKIESSNSSNNSSSKSSGNLMDRWITTRTIQLVKNVNELMDRFQFGQTVELLFDFIDDLTNWYIKFNRDRIKGNEGMDEWKTSITVLFNVMITYTRLWAPVTPFLSELIYQHLRPCSTKYCEIDYVLLTDFPVISESCTIDTETLSLMKDLQRVCTMVRNMRDNTAIHSRIVVPLKRCTVYHDDEKYLDLLEKNIMIIQSELNCLEFKFERLYDNATIKMEPNRKVLGQIFRKESNLVLELLERQSADFMRKVYDGTETIHYKSATYDEVVDGRFYKLYRVPGFAVETKNMLSFIDNDLMVTIDHTYDHMIHYKYQIKRLHSAVQRARKKMCLRPWNKITVILDAAYADQNIKNELEGCVANADVIIGDLEGDPTYGNNQGIHENEQYIVYGEQFVMKGYRQGPEASGTAVRGPEAPGTPVRGPEAPGTPVRGPEAPGTPVTGPVTGPGTDVPGTQDVSRRLVVHYFKKVDQS
jgi:isoleucyl-tRNA synthetase